MEDIVGLEDIELQEEASLGLECGNGQMDLPSHFQNGVQDNQTIMVLKINCLFQAIGVKGGLGMMKAKVTNAHLSANAGTFFDLSCLSVGFLITLGYIECLLVGRLICQAGKLHFLAQYLFLLL